MDCDHVLRTTDLRDDTLLDADATMYEQFSNPIRGCLNGNDMEVFKFHGKSRSLQFLRLILHRRLEVSILFYNTGRRLCQSVSRSNILATRSNFFSANGEPRICRPIGNPDFVKPHGMLMPGMPARLALIV
jgi:hypothetical protein